MSKQDRWKQEKQWYLNLAFYFGQQHVMFRGPNNNYELYVPVAPYYKVRSVINHTRKIVRKDIARLTSQKPNAYIVPASSEDKDLFAAQAGEQIWDATWRKHNFNRVVRNTCFWLATLGNGFIKQYWDPTKNDPDNMGPKGEALGDLCFEAITPFHLFVPDLKEEDLQQQAYVIHASLKNIEWAKKFYGVEFTPKQDTNVIAESFLNVLGADQFNSKDQVMLLEIYVQPGATNLLPNGGHFSVLNNQIVYGKEVAPYSHGKYPFSKADNIPTGKFYNESIIVDLIPLQRELNRTRGQIVEAKNRMAKPQLTAERGSVIVSSITSEPGQVIEYRTGFQPPQPLPLQDIPAYVLQEVDRILVDMADLSGQHEVSKGQVPPGVTAATAISFLQEQDESLLSVAYDSLEEAIENTAQQTLCMVKDYWETERLVKVTGLDGSFDAMMFRGSQLEGNTDIHVEGGSSLPTSKAAKQAFIMDLMKLGAIPMDEGLGVMDMGGLNKIYERIQVDVRQVQRENLRMRQITEEQITQHMEQWEQKLAAEAPDTVDPDSKLKLEAPPLYPANTWDNHQVHIEWHNRFRKGQSFEMAPPHVKAVFEEHVKHHSELMMETMAMGNSPLDPTGGQSAMMGTEGEPGAMPQPPQSGNGQPPGPMPEPQLGEMTSG